MKNINPSIVTIDDPAGKSKCTEKNTPKKLPRTLTARAMSTRATLLCVRNIAETAGTIRKVKTGITPPARTARTIVKPILR